MLAKVISRAQVGVEAPEVIIGLPGAAVSENRDRVRSALLNARFDFPPRRITCELGARRSSQGRRMFRPAHRARDTRSFRTIT